ncbi:BlaI/MecI/CopY family transcriptional regulator [Candidatus Blastococcus massiliensis]|uniref:BlaI/MecI/CopY family transcriptional regulator n=1 Tax=Candidatus Blastococcus massiliensis TaxID=1470358 RepID=UPI0004BA062B|nr:BlaI/MecI/CopY family transcriptional regulator [Candidatus Blastococcus massiliensis]
MPSLGKLEAAVMGVLWSAGGALTVREVLEQLPAQRNLAYTTVMTVLSNLHRKGMVERRPVGRAYSYLPAQSREAVAAASLREVLDASDDPRSVLLHFAETATDDESNSLRDGLAKRDADR